MLIIIANQNHERSPCLPCPSCCSACPRAIPAQPVNQRPSPATRNTPPPSHSIDTNAVLAFNEQNSFDKPRLPMKWTHRPTEHLRRIVGSTTSMDPFKVFRQFPFIKLNLPLPVNGHHSRLALTESVLPNLVVSPQCLIIPIPGRAQSTRGRWLAGCTNRRHHTEFRPGSTRYPHPSFHLKFTRPTKRRNGADKDN